MSVIEPKQCTSCVILAHADLQDFRPACPLMRDYDDACNIASTIQPSVDESSSRKNDYSNMYLLSTL
jgi:hypothetical protein